ncbi:cysteine desulfurase [Candidatus Saccharibacteria bacterium]|nr:cysteine desulfurase [Candidatus Saccharibacteria bacterium]
MTYLDYAATTPLLPEVITAMREAERKFFANASALHTPGHLAFNEIEKCRELLAEMVGCSSSEIIFTSGATESNNTVIRTFEGCQIETSPLEHHSILEAARVYGGDKEPKLYSYMLANNETGEYLWGVQDSTFSTRLRSPVVTGSAALSLLASSQDGLESTILEPQSYLHSDLTQIFGKVPINVKELGLDYATFSAHKIGGPVGVGALYVREGVPFKPLIIGGLQEKGRRGGTYNTVGIAGFRAALEYIKNRGVFEIYDTKVRNLRDTLASQILKEIPGSSLNTDISKDKSLPNILNASFRAAEGESIQLYLDAEGIIVSTGSACAAGDTKPSHVLMAKTGDAEIAHSSIRFSFGLDNTMEDVDKVMEVLPKIVDRLQQISTVS